MTTVDRWLLPDGIEELLPEDAARLERLRRNLLDLHERWGYQLVMPPLVEFTESLLIGLGASAPISRHRSRESMPTALPRKASAAIATRAVCCIPVRVPCWAPGHR